MTINSNPTALPDITAADTVQLCKLFNILQVCYPHRSLSDSLDELLRGQLNDCDEYSTEFGKIEELLPDFEYTGYHGKSVIDEVHSQLAKVEVK